MSPVAAAKREIPEAAQSVDLQYCHDYFESLFRTNFFKCLNDETRQKIILLAGQHGDEGMRVADIATHFDLDRTTISHHLAMLRDNNLLKLTKRGKERFYSVNVEYVIGVLEEVVRILKSCCR
ncbi:MAG: winged helix-turn-helix transcriptional regulator [Candidatus Hydrogenedentota bacterium]|nr:MAG: winged helix-turn-helix transcriptional regulator [Candidatus Hydrogenedentota bacterium]